MDNVYNYTYYKDYVWRGGYYWRTKQLPDWISIAIELENGSKAVYVTSRIHLDKVVKIREYSTDWNDQDIIKDISGEVMYRWVS